MDLTNSAKVVLEKRYLNKDESGNPIETPEDMFRRVANAVAGAEYNYFEELRNGSIRSDRFDEIDKIVDKLKNNFYEIMTNLEFLPNSPTLFNAGKETGTLSGCFEFDISDTMMSILDVNTKIGMVEKHGGGIGICLSDIRPKDFLIRSTQGKACGGIAVMKMIHATNDMITQGGKRAGAMMAIMRCDHPDIMEFINCKIDAEKHAIPIQQRLTEKFGNIDWVHPVSVTISEMIANQTLNGFNISVAVTDEFMKAVKNDANWNLVWNDEVIETVCARDLWNKICENAWKNGDPGLFFIDEANRYNPTPWLGQYNATNPCGEQMLLSNESCNLGSINLSKFVFNVQNKVDKYDGNYHCGKCDKIFRIDQGNEFLEHQDECNNSNKIDWERLKEVTQLAVRFLDNVIDINKFPVKEIEEATLRTRKIGLGVMGWADMLVKLDIPYNSDEAVELAEQVMKFIDNVAKEYSIKLASKRGTYSALREMSLNDLEKYKYDHSVRNATRTTIAPTGSISIIAGCSSGIEPIYSLVTKRSQMSGALENTELIEVHHLFKEYVSSISGINVELYNYDDWIKVVDKYKKKIFVTAHEIFPEWHLRMQAAFQKHTNNAVSKTINLPNSATVEDIKDVYMQAWKLGLKGITVYRDGSREKQVLSGVGKDKVNVSTLPKLAKEVSNAAEKILEEDKKIVIEHDVSHNIRSRGIDMYGHTKRAQTGCGWIYITVNSDNGGIREVFATLGKAGGCVAAHLQATCRLVSLALKNNISVENVARQLREIRCPRVAVSGGDKILSCPDAIAKILLEDIGKIETYRNFDDQDLMKYNPMEGNTEGVCPDCSAILVREEGCIKCHSCGFTMC